MTDHNQEGQLVERKLAFRLFERNRSPSFRVSSGRKRFREDEERLL